MLVAKRDIYRAIWTLADQGIVSLGNFLVSVQLARFLVPEEYGAFALLLSTFFLAHLANSSLLFYPMTVRIAGNVEEQPNDLILTVIALATGVSILFATAIACGLIILDRTEIVIPAAIQLLAWQTQEAARKGLIAQFRFQAAAVGDTVTYLGQAIAVASLAGAGLLTLTGVLYAMAIMSTTGAIVHILVLGLRRLRFMDPGPLLLEFWQTGRWAFTNNLVYLLRVQIFPWTLAIVAGPAATAGFQAVLNIANLTNPIMLGLFNAIAPATAQKYATDGLRSAWRVTYAFLLITAPLILVYCGIGAFFPELLLRLFYGANSVYLDLQIAVTVMLLSASVNLFAVVVEGFFFGVKLPYLAFKMNLSGFFVALLALPWIGTIGVTGACVGFLAGSVIRLLVSCLSLSTLLSKADSSQPSRVSGVLKPGAE